MIGPDRQADQDDHGDRNARPGRLKSLATTTTLNPKMEAMDDVEVLRQTPPGVRPHRDDARGRATAAMIALAFPRPEEARC